MVSDVSSLRTGDCRMGSLENNGLTSGQARTRLLEFGANELAPTQRTTVLTQLVRLFANPLIAILLVASVISAAVGEWVNATIITVMVLLGVTINFIQTYHSQRAVERLRTRVAPTATVLRDGVWGELPRSEIVPGDVIRLVPGDVVPADAALIDSEHLHVQESALTGESLPVEKQAAPEGPATSPERNTVYLGTSVVSGLGTALVTQTGSRAVFGDIAQHLAARPPETDFDRGTREFGLLIMRTVLFLVLFVFLINAALKRDPFESLLFAIALAVGLTPEFLPMITSVTLAQGPFTWLARRSSSRISRPCRTSAASMCSAATKRAH
jgi:Mg2+-importing ATPase